MKKIGIITIISENYGNRLQNYALQKYLQKYYIVETLKNKEVTNKKNLFILRVILSKYSSIKHYLKGNKTRIKNFRHFNKYICFSKKTLTIKSKINNEYDYFIVGSDQVWNPYFSRLRDIDLLCFAEDKKRIAFSASIGVEFLDDYSKNRIKQELPKFKAISVRENAGKRIIEEIINRRDIEVLIDPTLLLTDKEWDCIAKKPEQLKNSCNKYILTYFLGKESETIKKEIEFFAQKNGCMVINLCDKDDPFYVCGPSEFLFLEKHAFLICTDSFHASVFAFIYNRPFIIYERDDSTENMNSRLETLINKFTLEGRKFNGNNITEEYLKYDYSKSYKILEAERKKARLFLKRALYNNEEDFNN